MVGGYCFDKYVTLGQRQGTKEANVGNLKKATPLIVKCGTLSLAWSIPRLSVRDHASVIHVDIATHEE